MFDVRKIDRFLSKAMQAVRLLLIQAICILYQLFFFYKGNKVCKLVPFILLCVYIKKESIFQLKSDDSGLNKRRRVNGVDPGFLQRRDYK